MTGRHEVRKPSELVGNLSINLNPAARSLCRWLALVTTETRSRPTTFNGTRIIAAGVPSPMTARSKRYMSRRAEPRLGGVAVTFWRYWHQTQERSSSEIADSTTADEVGEAGSRRRVQQIWRCPRPDTFENDFEDQPALEDNTK